MEEKRVDAFFNELTLSRIGLVVIYDDKGCLFGGKGFQPVFGRGSLLDIFTVIKSHAIKLKGHGHG